MRLKQLFSASVYHVQVFTGFSGCGNSIHNKKNNYVIEENKIQLDYWQIWKLKDSADLIAVFLSKTFFLIHMAHSSVNFT